jgi:hypothetical protein
MSLLSLLLLLALFGGLAALRATNEREGKLGSISTAVVEFGVDSIDPTAAAQDEDAAPTTPPARPPVPSQPSGRASAGQSVISAEVLGSTEEAAPGARESNVRIVPPTATQPPRPQFEGGGSSGGTSPRPTREPRSDFVFIPTAVTGNPGLPTPTTAASNPTPTTAASNPTPTPDAGGGSNGEVVRPLGSGSHLTMPGFVGPGAYKNGGIRVTNGGQIAFNYSLSMSTAGDQDFAQVLRLRIYLRVGPTCDYPGQPPAGSDLLPLTGDQVGTIIYDGNFATGSKFGDATVEIAVGDRFLDIGANEVLCMEVFFPWDAGNQYQGKSVNGTLVFTAKSPDGT